MEKLKEIIRSCNMSTRPEFTSGRGAILCDLNGTQLEKIYQGIKNEFGEKAADNYVKMVRDIKVMSCTTFLEELYMLCSNNWKYTKKKTHAAGVTVPKDENGEYDLVGGMFGMMNAMMSSGRDETPQIKNYFLSNHGVKPKGRMVSNGYEVMYYFD